VSTIEIAHTWDGSVLPPGGRTRVHLDLESDALRIDVDAPFAGDPPPVGFGSVSGLWEHEVVEVFVFGHDETYTEIELGPHGHWLVLRFDGVRRRVDDGHEIQLTATIHGDRWRGAAWIHVGLLPERPARCNAFRISGREPNRRYEAAEPVPGERPDFHRPDVGMPWPMATTRSP
jgi:hypothetical protein